MPTASNLLGFIVAVNIKRAVAGSIVMLLLAVTSMAAACDLSCAFGFADSDCHAGAEPAHDSMDMGGMNMDMPRMSTPGADQLQASPVASEVSQTKGAHPSIGDLGPCERQSCDGSSFVATSAGRSNVARVSLVPAIVQNLAAAVAAQILHSPRDGISRPAPYPYQGSPLPQILRI
jgi:hypothetical protein